MREEATEWRIWQVKEAGSLDFLFLAFTTPKLGVTMELAIATRLPTLPALLCGTAYHPASPVVREEAVVAGFSNSHSRIINSNPPVLLMAGLVLVIMQVTLADLLCGTAYHPALQGVGVVVLVLVLVFRSINSSSSSSRNTGQPFRPHRNGINSMGQQLFRPPRNGISNTGQLFLLPHMPCRVIQAMPLLERRAHMVA
jgi:hypothetical protein